MPEDIEMLDFEAFKERYEKVPVEEYPNNVREAVPDPVVSVHLLTYNHADYIEEAIESVLMQEVDFPIEIVLGDDDSSDGTREICIEYAKQYPDLIRLQLHHRENNIHLHGGPTHLFQYWYNTLSARGKYIAILSGDDYWTDPLKLQKQAKFLKANPKYSLSFHDAGVINESGEIISDSKTPNKNKRDLSKKELMSWVYIIPSTYLGLNIFEKVPDILASCLHEDVLTVALMGESGEGTYQEEVEPTLYRLSSNSVWKSKSERTKNETLAQTYINMCYFFKSKNSSISEIYLKKYLNRVTQLIKINLNKKDIINVSKNVGSVIGKSLRAGKAATAFGFMLNKLE